MTQVKWTLELLPAELHIAIFFQCPDLDSILALARASPLFYHVYRRVREELLTYALYAEYDGIVDITDAIVALRSRSLHASIPSNVGKIYSLLDQWRRHEEIRGLGLPSASDLPDRPIDSDEVVKLHRLHRIMKFCLNSFSSTLSPPEWFNKKRWKKDILPISLSRVEKTRLLRGLYRLQIYGNIFGPLQREPVYGEKRANHDYDHWKGLTFSPEEGQRARYGNWEDITFSLAESWRVFFGTMKPWEFQEFGCVWQHICEQYTEPYEQVAEHFSKLGVKPIWNIRAKGIHPLPTNMWIYDTNELSGAGYYNQPCLATMGPAFFYKFMSKPDFLHRRDLLLVNLGFCEDKYFPYEIWPFDDDNSEPFPLPLMCPTDRFDLGHNV